MNWINLTDLHQLDEIDALSQEKSVMIMKHSTRCSISSTALNRLERGWGEAHKNIQTYFLDLLQFRNISNAIASRYNVEHESPQVLIIRNGKCVYDAAHTGISAGEIGDIDAGMRS
jgi:bacillithiol system protein YtxJ